MAPAPTSPKPTHNVRMKPAEEEVQLVMQRLGIESDEARTALSKGLPKGWLACRADDGEAYYHQPSTGVTQWRHPGRDWTSADATKLATELVKSRGDDPTGDEETSPEHSVYDARSRHVELETPDSLFSATAGIVREDIVGRAFALRGLLTPEEAATYVKSAQKAGFGQSDVSREFPPSLRNNSRLIHFSDALALALYRRLVPHLAHRDVYLVQPMGFGAEGRWKPVGVNPCFRISQYKEREHFATHCDGMYANDNDECSIYSLVLYLNEDYEGGELEFTESGKRFRPTAGTAVLLPHDLSHAGQEVLQGTKYVARSELMFRCVDRRPPPAVPQYADDPLFQRMAALYEQIGDLAAKGDALATTEAYQEALGIQIAHQGTDVKQRDARPLPFEDKAVEYILSFLDPLEVGRILTVCRRWCSVSMAGALWQGFCRQRWPNESEVLEGAAYGLEPELKDWLGFYRKQHILSTKAPVSVIFFASALQIWAEKSEQTEVKAVPALFAHDLDGIGWDSSFKQRVGWEVGTHPWSRKRFWHGNAEALNDAGNQDNRKGYLQGRARHNKAFEMPGFGQVDFEVLSEAFDWAFRKLGIRPSDHHLVVPVLPSLFKQSSRARLAQILSRRFQVPRLSMVDAPLCALRARELKTGAVIWGEQLSRSTIFFYVDGEDLATSEDFHYHTATAKDLARLLTQATELLGPLMAARVLGDVVLSPQLSLEEDGKGVMRVNRNIPPWADSGKLEAAMVEAGIGAGTFRVHGPLEVDVVEGARCMAEDKDLALVVPPTAPDVWQWRVHADGQWLVLPQYISGVFEGAFRADKQYATVQTQVRAGVNYLYLVADLESFRVALSAMSRFAFIARDSGVLKNTDVQRAGPWCRLTRFLPGKPSETPDLRKPEDIERALRAQEEVAPVAGRAVHVRNLAGRLILSTAADEAADWGVPELLEQLAMRLGVEANRLKLLDAAEELDPMGDFRQRVSSREVVELQVLLGPKPKGSIDDDCRHVEHIPEDLPGSQKETSFLELMSRMRTLRKSKRM